VTGKNRIMIYGPKRPTLRFSRNKRRQRRAWAVTFRQHWQSTVRASGAASALRRRGAPRTRHLSHCCFLPKSRAHASAPANTIWPLRAFTPALMPSASLLLGSDGRCRQSSKCLQMFFGCCTLRDLLARRSAKWPVRPCQTTSCPALSPFLFVPIFLCFASHGRGILRRIRGPRLGLRGCVGQALTTETIAECIRSGGALKTESDMDFLALMSISTTADWDASVTVERINL
jgi:hypothetical protein